MKETIKDSKSIFFNLKEDTLVFTRNQLFFNLQDGEDGGKDVDKGDKFAAPRCPGCRALACKRAR